MILSKLLIFIFNLCVMVAWQDTWKILDQTAPAGICEEDLYMMGRQVVGVMYGYTGQSNININGCWNSSGNGLKSFDAAEFFTQDSSLQLEDVQWSPTKDYYHLKEIYLRNVTPVDSWNYCSDLNVLHIYQTINLSLASEGWLSNCSSLEYILMNGLSVDQMIAVVRSAPSSVNTIDLYEVPGRHRFCSFEPVISKEKRASCGELSAALVTQLARLPQLKTLYVETVELDFCVRGSNSPVRFPSLRYVALQNTRTYRMCFRNTRAAPLLAELVIQGRIGISVQFSELIAAPAPRLLVNFNGVAVVAFQFRRDDYLALGEESKVILEGLTMPLDCSCTTNIWLVQAMRAGLVEAPGLFCTNGSAPQDMVCERLPCQRISCDSSCVCCQDGPAIIADCRDANIFALSTELLRMDNLTEILAPNNNISTLPENLPDSLVLLDLKGNNIWKLGAGHVGALFAHPERRVRLAGNSIFCSCEYQNLIATVQHNRNKVDDFNDLRCDFTDEKLGEVVVSELCATRDRDAVIKMAMSIALGLVVIVLMIAVAWHHRRELKIFLYARGWCLCCINEEELDLDRLYDVFLSFSHEDTQLVINELLPVLDKDYSVCVHHRDWCPGEMIPTQIALSVERSRRTVVVLSRSFVRSLWGRLEFQTAHFSGLREGRVRVIMIVLDDVLERDELSAEMRAYVRLNTYVRWGDPWLWDKLRYVLPHRPLRHTITELPHSTFDALETSINISSAKDNLNDKQTELQIEQ